MNFSARVLNRGMKVQRHLCGKKPSGDTAEKNLRERYWGGKSERCDQGLMETDSSQAKEDVSHTEARTGVSLLGLG